MEHNVGNRSCCLLVFLLVGYKCEPFELLAWFPDRKPCQVNLYADDTLVTLSYTVLMYKSCFVFANSKCINLGLRLGLGVRVRIRENSGLQPAVSFCEITLIR